MDIREIPITDINPAPYNPRVNLTPDDPRYQRIERSLDRWGVVEVLVWNEHNGTLVGGHQRLKIMQNKGMETAFVSVVNLEDLDEEKALNIALNNSRGENEETAVLAILQAMKDHRPDLVEDAGYDEERMMELIKDSEPPGPDDSGAAPVTPAPPAEFDPLPSSVIDLRQIPMQARRKHWIGRGLDTTIMDPVVAELILRWYAKPGMGVLDPWATDETWGCVASMMGMDYVGFTQAVEENGAAWGEVGNEELPEPEWRGDTRLPDYPSADLVFTALPGYAMDQEGTKERMDKLADALNMDRFMVLVMSEARNDAGVLIDAAGSMCRWARMAGLTFVSRSILVVEGAPDGEALGKFSESRVMYPRHLQMLVFLKGDLGPAVAACEPLTFKGMDAEGE